MIWVLIILIGVVVIGATFILLKKRKSQSEYKASLMMSGEYEEV